MASVFLLESIYSQPKAGTQRKTHPIPDKGPGKGGSNLRGPDLEGDLSSDLTRGLLSVSVCAVWSTRTGNPRLSWGCVGTKVVDRAKATASSKTPRIVRAMAGNDKERRKKSKAKMAAVIN